MGLTSSAPDARATHESYHDWYRRIQANEMRELVNQERRFPADG